MKKVIALILCAIFVAAMIPFSVSAAGAVSGLPFDLKAPESVSAFKAEGSDSSSVDVVFTVPGEINTFLRDRDDALLHTTDDDDVIGRFMAATGYDEIWVFAQIDWAIDDVDDEVSGWHYTQYWDTLGDDEEYNRRVSAWDVVDGLEISLEMTQSCWMLRGVSNSLENWGWWGGETMPGVKDQLREGQYYFRSLGDGDEEVSINYSEHTAYFRVRLLVETWKGDERERFFSDWSDTASYGKDTAVWEPFTKETLPAPEISNLEMTMDEFNDYPIVTFDLHVDDVIVEKLPGVEARGGGIRFWTEARIPGETDWVALQGDWVISEGRQEADLVSLSFVENPDLIIGVNVSLELRCRYRCEQYISFEDGEYLGEFYTDYSNVLKIEGKETVKGSGDVNGDGKVNVRDIAMMMRAQAGWSQKDYVEANQDYTGDGKFNARDIAQLMRDVASGKVS